MPIAAVFTLAQNWKQVNVHLGEQDDYYLWHIRIMESYSTKKVDY